MKPCIGKVILAGAGPGDPGLLTLRAAEWLQKADVVLTDRLVSPQIIDTWVRPDAQVVFVGKQAGISASFSQEGIHELMVYHARLGKIVVRLKGGDITLFSHLYEELTVLVREGIPYELVPGVTAALGAAAYAGIPLTARGYARSVRFLSLHRPSDLSEESWRELSATENTLVLYMSAAQLPELARRLVGMGMYGDRELAIIEEATTPAQRTTIYSLAEMAAYPEAPAFRSPALVLIGKVVALHDLFRWKEEDPIQPPYFGPIGVPEKLHPSLLTA